MTVQMALEDGLTIARRNLIKIKRVPDLLVFTTLSPIMFVLLFAYVFGSAISVPGTSYREFLIAGIFTQTVIFGATWTGLGMVEDIQKGIIDRFRSLPMAPSAVLTGRTSSDVLINVISLVVMSLTGLLVGWRIHSSFPRSGGGLCAASVLRVRVVVGHGCCRALDPDTGGIQQRELHRHLSAVVHREHFCRDHQSSRPAQSDRRMESGVGGYSGGA